MIQPSEDERGEWTRVISIRVSEELYEAIKRTRIKVAPYIRTMIKELILEAESQNGKKVWKKR